MANNDNFIDILTVIDAKSLVSDCGPNQSTSGNAIVLGGRLDASKYIYMLVKRSEVVGIEAQPELKVAVKTGNIIRWRLTSLTVNTGYSTLLYRMNISGGSGLITTPAPYEASIKVPKPEADDNGGVTINTQHTQPYKDFYFQSTARTPGDVTYQLYFMLSDDQGKPFGYFYWDPYLTITRS